MIACPVSKARKNSKNRSEPINKTATSRVCACVFVYVYVGTWMCVCVFFMCLAYRQQNKSAEDLLF